MALPQEFRLGPVRLAVTDIDRSRTFYEQVIGLHEMDAADGAIRLTSGDGEVVLELVEEPKAKKPTAHAGLYHVALLFPTRIELARVIARIAHLGVPIQGASDHHTHEAMYLADPDGNGLELAADRPSDVWPAPEDVAGHRPAPLDIDGMLTLIDGEELVTQASPGVRIGHLHLHVGNVEEALRYYVEAVGFDPMLNIGSAGFVSAGGYHHHLGFNVWKGEGVPALPDGVIGLRFWSGLVPSRDDLDALVERTRASGFNADFSDGTVVLRDPWHQELRISVDPNN
jgi:catechol 2,3-dioxygenase